MGIGQLSMSKLVQIEITSICNLKCKMCPKITDKILSSDSPGPMSDRVWKSILPFAKKAGAIGLTVYGEALTDPDFIPRIKELDSLGIISTFSTNGILISKKIASELGALRYLSNINISIDSPDPEVYKKVRGGNLESVWTGVKNLREHTNRITISSLLMKSTIGTLPEFPAILSRLGIKKWILSPLKTKSEDLIEEHLHFAKDVDKTMARIIVETKKEKIKLKLFQKDRTDLEISDSDMAKNSFLTTKNIPEGVTRDCIMPWAWPTVNKDGLVFPCCYISDDADAIMGDVTKESLEDIWFGKRFEHFRKNITLSEGNSMLACCKTCTQAPLTKRHSALPNRFGISPVLLKFNIEQYLRWIYGNLKLRMMT